MNVGDSVRPVVRIAGLDSRLIYRVAEVNSTPFVSVAWLIGPDGALTRPVENAHLVLEKVSGGHTIVPCAAVLN